MAKKIKKIFVREVLNSQGDFCIELSVELENGIISNESVPIGKTVGKYDATQIDLETVRNYLPQIENKLKGIDPNDQHLVDSYLIKILGTENGRIRGSNLSSAISMAVCRAASITSGLPLFEYIGQLFQTKPTLPKIVSNLIEGKPHAGNEMGICECMVIPVNVKGFNAIKLVSAIYSNLRLLLQLKLGISSTNVGFEGGFAPNTGDEELVITLLDEAIKKTTNDANTVELGFDFAGSNIYNPEQNNYKIGSKKLSTENLLDYYENICNEYNVGYLEDPFNEDDFTNWCSVRERIRRPIVIGDDLTSSSPNRLMLAIQNKALDGIILKINQCGTLSELGTCYSLAKKHSVFTVISHRSSETDSDFIMHLAVGLGSDFVKAGACARERIIKYNTLIRIEEHMSNYKLNSEK
jgi:enolase